MNSVALILPSPNWGATGARACYSTALLQPLSSLGKDFEERRARIFLRDVSTSREFPRELYFNIVRLFSLFFFFEKTGGKVARYVGQATKSSFPLSSFLPSFSRRVMNPTMHQIAPYVKSPTRSNTRERVTPAKVRTS